MRLAATLRRRVILAVLALTVILSEPVAERYGDRLQYVLPALGLGCAVVTGGWAEYLLRYGAVVSMVQGSKSLLGERPINRRPNGEFRGFPSAHTAGAVFGASALVNDCIKGSPVTQAAVLLAAGFTGASRIEAGAHSIWQVLAGAIVGLLAERLWRRQAPGRRAITRPFLWLWKKLSGSAGRE